MPFEASSVSVCVNENGKAGGGSGGGNKGGSSAAMRVAERIAYMIVAKAKGLVKRDMAVVAAVEMEG
jgi:hypothetical protein